MIRFQQMSIHNKLSLALGGAALLAFALAGAALALFGSLTLERRARQIMEPYAQLVSVGAEAAVAFEDPGRAREILSTLRANPQILAAQIVLRDGRLLAGYSSRSNATFRPNRLKPDGVYLNDNTAELLQSLQDGAHLRLVMGLDELNRHTRNALLLFAAGVLVLLVATTLGLRAALQRTIVRPISTLAETVEQVRSLADYQQRVPASGDDEVARLGKSFNAMMGAIQDRDNDLGRLTFFQRAILDNAAYGIISCAPDGFVNSFNPAAERLLGYTASEVEEKETPLLWHDPEEVAERARQLSEELGETILPGFDVFAARPRHNLPEENEWTFIRKDATRVPVLLSVTTLRDDNEGLIGFVGLVNDLTERKRAEEALRYSEELLRITLENILDPVFITDDEGRFTFICGNVHLVLGYTVEDIRAMGNISALLGEGLFSLEELERRGEIRNIDCVITNKDGSSNDYFVTVKRVSIMGGTILYVCRDITDRKQAEEALREGEAFLSSLLNAIPIPVFYKDRVGRYLGCNRAYETFFGATRDQLIGKTAFDISPRELAESYHAKDTELFESGGVQQYESQVKDTQGVLRDIIFNKAVYTDSQGTIIGLIGAILDITERKRAEEDLRKLNEELEQRVRERTADLNKRSEELSESQGALMNIVEDLNEKTSELEQANFKLQELDRLKSMFIASMSHELRTPLNSVIGFSSVLLNEWLGPINAEQKENLVIILRSGKHLLNLINDVIDVSKIEAGKIESAEEEFDLHDLVSEAVSLVKKELGEKGLDLRVAAAHQRMRTDRRRLLQCVLNLLSNAMKFTERGSVTVETRIVRSPGATPEADVAEISVTDTGIGIREEDIEKMFQPFERLASPLQATIPGTGLGLYLTRKLAAEVLKGDILLTSEYGKGSRFTLRIPVRMP